MGLGGIRPRSQGGKYRGLVNFVEIHKGEGMGSSLAELGHPYAHHGS